ncbi:MAG: response regulator [Planctomycetota bacterium]|jgi:CheY-like chemotaxis protein
MVLRDLSSSGENFPRDITRWIGIMQSANSKRVDLVGEKGRRDKNCESKTRILIINGRPVLRQGLVNLIDRECNLGVCVEADDFGEALDVIEKYRIDLAIVDISQRSAASIELTERIRFKYPNLPLLTLSVDYEAIGAESPFQTEAGGGKVSGEAAEKILAAIHYVRSLLRNRLYGFTVLVKI